MTMLEGVAELLRSSPGAFVGVIFLLGLMVGSFLNVVIYRLPIMLERQWRAEQQAAQAASMPEGGDAAPILTKFNLVVPNSACPACKAPIRAWQNIPVVSWLFLGGKCANCKAPISIRYPIVELVTGVLSAAVAWRYGFGAQAAFALLITWCLIALSGIDLDTTLLPDVITLPLLWVGLLASLGSFAGSSLAVPVEPRSAIIGAAVGYMSLWSLYWVFKLLTGKEGMGYGDFKLFAALGAWMGVQMLLPIILFASFTGAVVGIALIFARRLGRNAEIPFGPYLAAAGWIALMWGPQIVDRYLSLYTRGAP